MCRGDDHLAWKHPVSLEACRGLRGFTVTSLDSPSLIKIGGRLTRVSDQSDQRLDQGDMDSQIVTVDQFAVALASILEALGNLGQRIDGQQAQQVPVQEVITWEDFDGAPVASLSTKFKIPEIERYTGIGCPRIHLRLYSTVMRAHELDEAQMVMFFPMSLSGATHRWFASLDVSRCKTWDNLAQEFLRQFTFNTIIDVSRRELEALRERPNESVTSFISRWREKISQIIDRPSENDQISMIMRSLQPRFGIDRGLWPKSSPTDSKEKKPSRGQRSRDVGVISSAGMRPSRHYQTVGQTSGFYYPPSPHVQYRSPAPFRPMTPTYLHPVSQPVFAAHVIETSPIHPAPKLRETTTYPIPPRFRLDLHYSYHQGPGHNTDHYNALRHAIQDLIDQGLVNLGQPSVTTNPLPAHSTHADDSIHMLSWDDGLPEPIVLHDSYEIDGVSLGPQAPSPFSLIPDEAPFQLTHSTPLVIGCQDSFVSFTLWPDDDDSDGRKIQIVTRSGRIAQPPPPAVIPFEGAVSHEELQSTQARIYIWSLLASSNTHRDALIRALNDDLPTEGSDHVHPLYITVCCSGHRVSSILMDNGPTLNICPLATAITLGFAPSDFGPSTQTLRAYDNTKMEVIGTLVIDLQIGPATFSTLFQVLRIPTSFNLLLGRPWIHRARVIMVWSTRDMFASSKLVLQISHSEDDLFLTGFTFDQIQTLEIEDFCRDFIAMGMTFLVGMGLGRLQQGLSEFIAAIDHAMTFRLGFIPTKVDYYYMARLSKERVRARLSHTPFDYLIRSYRMSLVDYFVRGSEIRPRLEEIDSVVHIDRETKLQHLFHQLQLSDGAPDTSFPMAITHTFPDQASLLSLYFLEEITDDGVIVDPTEMIDGFVIRNEYRDEMDMMTVLKGTQTILVPKLLEDDSSLFEGTVSLVEEVSDLMDPPLSFDVLSGFVSRSNNCSHVSCDNISISVPHSPTSQIFDIDDEIAQPDSDKDSFDHNSNPIDERVSPTIGNVETVDFGTEDQPKELKIGSPLSIDERYRLIHLLRSYLDVFAWSYEDMSSLDPSIVQHHLPTLPHARPIKQKLRRLHPRWSLVGFISMVKYPEWLANVVPVPKKNGKVRVCVDFRDLNKTSLKDDFLLPHIDLLILMALEDMEKKTFITEWGTYCYRVKPFGLKNERATYQRVATTLFHDMMHRDVEVYEDDVIVKSRNKANHLEALERLFERIRKFRLRLNPKKYTFGMTSGKLLGHMVSERGIEVNLDKIKAILDMPASKTKKDIRGFLSKLQYINCFIAKLTDICEPIFRLLRKNQPTIWNDDLPPTLGRPLLLYLSISDMTLGCMLAQIDDSGKERAIYYLSKRMLEYEMRYVMIELFFLALVWATRRLRNYMMEYSVHLISRLDPIVADHLALLPTSEDIPVDDDFLDEEFVAMTSLSGWCMYFDGAANQSGYGIGVLSVRLAFPDQHPIMNNIVEYEACIFGLETALELGIRQMEVFGDSNLVLRQIQGDWKTRDVKLRSCHSYLKLLVARFDDLRHVHLPRAQNWLADALATLASYVDIPIDVVVRPLLIELRFAPAYCCLIAETEVQDDLPWYHDIYQFLRFGTYPEVATAKDQRALRHLATRFVICGDTLYKQSTDGMLLLCLDRASIMRTGYFWLTMETDCCQFVQKCLECQIHGDLIHALPSELHISPKSSNDHVFILVAIDYFTKWVEAASYVRLTSARVASFIISHIICRYGVPHDLISDRGVHFRAEVDTLLQEYVIRHYKSSAYRPQTNGAVEAVNKNIKTILRKIVENSRDWSEKLSFALWAYGTSFRTSIGATPYSLVYGMEVVLPVKIEMGSLRVALKQQIFEREWAQAQFDWLNLLDEKRLRATDHVQAYQRKMARAFRKWVKPRALQKEDLVLRILRCLIGDPRGKFRPSWSGPYVIREFTC
ncbi:hypothetical protein AAG906_005729 [Vitis piasezkii]